MSMHTKTLTVRFLSPAFLGDAEQRGAWRTPPFKAQLRQWWRLVLAVRGRDWGRIRGEEAELFGNAWPDQKAMKSQIRLRLGEWRVSDKQVNRSISGNVDALIYLGYGRFDRNPQAKPAIDAGETAQLRIAWPAAAANGSNRIEEALALMSRFGTVGGRSRNGWGSYVLDGARDAVWNDYLIYWRDALCSDWVRGIGRDERGPLIWRTRDSWPSWDKVLQQLARVRATIAKESADRCLLSYPVTKHALPGWSARDRLPNSLRLKVVEDTHGRLHGELIHFPCRPSDALWNKMPESDAADKKRRLIDVWTDAHKYLDEENALERVNA
ncbi:RAMP superfamily CRISPR-associated protein [Nitrococcus mobilis]|uniref:CRISPR type III-associated protein domain-containing protein n=1 Tax=Nitrococcus mobilis Nb-231 TaxID=314278 RepID=A4BL67_9GAMM|nr:RAMP superfamily CRISPR-associated protein [Nitrococcus mobilis]EAR23055.1 hypothetical protein NB231_14583 [Nitrococcus mobilis Nb-231]